MCTAIAFDVLKRQVHDYLKEVFDTQAVIHEVMQYKLNSKSDEYRMYKIPTALGLTLLHCDTDNNGRVGDFDLAIVRGSRYDVLYMEGYIPPANAIQFFDDSDLTSTPDLVSYFPNYKFEFEMNSQTPEEVYFQYSLVLKPLELVGALILGTLREMKVDKQMSLMYSTNLLDAKLDVQLLKEGYKEHIQ